MPLGYLRVGLPEFHGTWRRWMFRSSNSVGMALYVICGLSSLRLSYSYLCSSYRPGPAASQSDPLAFLAELSGQLKRESYSLDPDGEHSPGLGHLAYTATIIMHTRRHASAHRSDLQMMWWWFTANISVHVSKVLMFLRQSGWSSAEIHFSVAVDRSYIRTKWSRSHRHKKSRHRSEDSNGSLCWMHKYSQQNRNRGKEMDILQCAAYLTMRIR